MTGVGVCRSEILSLQLEIPPNHDSGITVCEDRELLLISHITHQSPAYRYENIQRSKLNNILLHYMEINVHIHKEIQMQHLVSFQEWLSAIGRQNHLYQFPAKLDS